MKLDNITIFRSDGNYIAIFINGIKQFETNSGELSLWDMMKTISENGYYFNNTIRK